MHLVIQTAFLGDMILTTPLIERLSQRGPVDVVATPANAPLLANNPFVRDVIVFDKRGAHRGIGGMRVLASQLRRRTTSAVPEPRGSRAAYMAQGSLRSAALARMAGIPEIIGFSSSAGKWLYTTRIPYEASRHHAVRLMMLDGFDGFETDVPRPRLYPTTAEQHAVTQLLAAAGIGDSTPLIVLAPGSVWATKRWPYYDKLAVILSQSARGTRVVVTGSASDNELHEQIASLLRDAALPAPVNATGALSLLGTAALIARARLVVSNDSAPLHLASAMNTPTIALFGPTVPAFGFGPLADQNAVVEHPALSCRPCDAHGPKACPLGHWRCMREIDAALVAEKALALVG